MKLIILSFVLIVHVVCGQTTLTPAQSLPAETIAKIDSLFASYQTNYTPGAIIGIIHQGKVIYQRAYGMADVENNKPLQINHAFWVASVSKQFTAMSIALLVEQGKVNLEDDIRKYLTQLPHMGDTIRVKHLIYHTSGIRDGFTLIGMTFKGEKHYTNENVIRALTNQQNLNFKPGQRHEYNNGGYVLLAQIVAKASGIPFPQYVQENIFNPLSMNHSKFYGKITDNIPNLAQGYDVKYRKNKLTYKKGHFTGNTVGSSGLITTLEDLYKWDQNFYHNRLGKGNPELIRQILTPGKLNDGSTLAYGFGLEVEPYQNQLAITHSGSDKGYKAEIVRFPNLQLSIICLSNADNLYNLTAKLLKIGEWISPVSFQTLSASVHTEPDSLLLEGKAGFYLNQENQADFRKITVKNRTLHAARSISGYEEALQAKNQHTFVNRGLGEYSYQFTLSEDGHSKQLNYKERANSLILQHVQPVSLKANQLKAYTGKYYSKELNKYYHLTIRKGKLGLRILHIFHIPLQPIEGNRFLADLIGNNCLKFITDTNGHITGFYFNREGVGNLAFTKIK